MSGPDLQPFKPIDHKAAEPGVDRVGFAGAKQPQTGNRGGALSIIYFNEGGRTLTQIGLRGMVA